MKDMYEEKLETNKILIVVIVILSILLLGTIGFIIYDKIIAQEDTKTEEVQNQIKDDTKTEENQNKQPELKEDKIVPITEQKASVMLEQIDTYNLKLSKFYPIDDINKIDSTTVVDMTYTKIPNIRYEKDANFMQSDLEKVVAKYFGNEYKVIHQDIPCFCNDKIVFKYNSAKRNYTFYGMHGHGGGSLINIGYTYFIDGTYNETQNKYIINTKVMYRDSFSDVGGPTTGYYATASDAMNKTNPIYIVNENEIETLQPETVYNKVKEQIRITSYEFRVDSDGNYGLTKVSLN